MSHAFAKRINPYTEFAAGLLWGAGSGVMLAACFGMIKDIISSIGVTISCHAYTGAIVGATVALISLAASSKKHLLFPSVMSISCALMFSMVQHQFADSPMIIASIIIAHVILLAACFSLEKVWH